jgi:predicted amidohydrolase YtcJ
MSLRIPAILAGALIALAALAGCGGDPPGDIAIAADPATVYTARQVLTMDARRPTAQAIAVAGERILAVGSLDEVFAALGERPHSRNDRFADKVILPGFIDQHVHPLLAALSMSMAVIAIEDWVLPDGVRPAATNREDYLAQLAAAEAGVDSPTETLYSWGFHHYFHGHLARGDLDAISDTRPIVVWHRSAHEFILNTPALERFGVDGAFVEQLPPAVQAQADLAAGHFREMALFPVLELLMVELATPERLGASLAFVEDYLHRAGVTLIAEPGGVLSQPVQQAQNAVLGDADTPFLSYFIVDGKTLANTSLENLIQASESVLDWGEGKARILPRHAKLFADGAIFSQAMQMLDGYTDGHEGEWMMDLDVFARAFDTYWDAGYQVHIHQNGDAGLAMVIDLLEKAQARKPREDHRTTIVHFGFSTPEQVERLSDLGAIVSANPYYVVALADNYREHGIGPERADEMVRLGDVVRAGIPLSLHSDMSMAPGQPLFLVWCAVNRRTPAGRVAGPDQRLSVEQALRAITLDAAYSLRLEKELGSIEPGKKATFTVLEQNPFEVDPMALRNIPVWGTVLEGRVFPLE